MGRGISKTGKAEVLTGASHDVSANEDRELKGMAYAVLIDSNDNSVQQLDLSGKANESDSDWARSAYGNLRIKVHYQNNNNSKKIYMLSSADQKKVMSDWRKSFKKRMGGKTEVPNTPENRKILNSTRIDAIKKNASRIVTKQYLQGEGRKKAG